MTDAIQAQKSLEALLVPLKQAIKTPPSATVKASGGICPRELVGIKPTSGFLGRYAGAN